MTRNESQAPARTASIRAFSWHHPQMLLAMVAGMLLRRNEYRHG